MKAQLILRVINASNFIHVYIFKSFEYLLYRLISAGVYMPLNKRGSKKSVKGVGEKILTLNEKHVCRLFGFFGDVRLFVFFLVSRIGGRL